MIILSTMLLKLSIQDVPFPVTLSTLIRSRFQAKPATLLIPIGFSFTSRGGGALRYSVPKWLLFLISKLPVHSVNFAAKLVHTRRALSSNIVNFHQEPGAAQACHRFDPRGFIIFSICILSTTLPNLSMCHFQ